MKLVIVTACRNARDNFDALCASIDEQTSRDWVHVVVDDASDPEKSLVDVQYDNSDRRRVILNDERRWALRNIIDVAREYQEQDDVIIGTVDGDDQLCDPNCVETILETYRKHEQLDVLWTGHKWDINEEMNVSREMPQKVDPYEYPWCSSHFRTFRARLLKDISDENFKDYKGEWFRRGYDQALMLPVLKVGDMRGYIDAPMYLYRMDSCSIPLVDRPGSEVEQVHNIAFIRARGFVG